MFEIISLKSSKIFSLNEINSLLPLIYRITEEYSKEVKYLMACVEAFPSKNSDRCVELQDKINYLIQKWQNKMERMGGKPKGLWLADFDNGNGYYCWKFPETTITHAHGYQDGFTGRRLIDNNPVDKIQPKIQNTKDENCFSPN